MKHQWLHRLTALLLVLAMSLSMATTASAVEVDTASEEVQDTPAASESEEKSNSVWDVLPTEKEEENDDSSDSSDAVEIPETPDTDDEDSSADSSVPTQDPADSDVPAQDPADSSTPADGELPDSSADSSVPTDESILPVDGELIDSDEPLDVDPSAVQEGGWSYTTAEDGKLEFSFLYDHNGTLVKAADGFFLLPTEDLTVTTETVNEATGMTESKSTIYHFQEGIYSFDKHGLWEDELEEEPASVTLTSVEEEEGTLVVEDTDSKVLELGSADIKESENGVVISSHIDYFDGKFNSLYYFEGDLYSGLFRFNADGKLYKITDGSGALFTGTMSSSHKKYICNYELVTKRDNLYYKKGKIFTGLRTYNLYYYTDGKKDTSVSGWKKLSGKTYYLKEGKAVTGNKRIKRNGNTYRYTFRDNGSLVTDMFKYNNSYKKKKLRIVLSRETHTGTILAYNSDSEAYDIPVKSFVVSMSKKSSNTKSGTYKLTQRKRWWKYKSGLWYQYATYVSGSGSWVHSEQYSKKSVHSLKAKSYNGLGTNQSKQCIRMQVVNCKLIYDLAKSNKNVRVVLTKSGHNIPFGKMTLNNNYDHEGKVSGNYDPTDPAV